MKSCLFLIMTASMRSARALSNARNALPARQRGEGSSDASFLLPYGRRWRGAPDEGLPLQEQAEGSVALTPFAACQSVTP